MKKYLSIFRISFAQEFAYRTNFVMWRVRNVIQVLIAYFLWSTVFSAPNAQIFGYDKSKILTYVFGIILIRALVFSARSVDVPSEISDGTISNYLLKPVAYFRYWFTRDVSSKALNFAFSVFEFIILAIIFKPALFMPISLNLIFLFLISLVIANYLIFIIRFIVTSVTFWVPELGWGGQFLFMVVITEFLSGSIFPLDIFPFVWQKIFYFTPFPYLIFFPLQVFLGKIPTVQIFQGIGVSIIWCVVLTYALKSLWQKGLRVYSSEGR